MQIQVVLRYFHNHSEHRVSQLCLESVFFFKLCLIENPKEESGSIIWTVLFPILALLILSTLGIWKRKEVKSFYGKTIKKFGK